MDKLTQYREIATRLLREFVGLVNRSAQPGAETLCVFDTHSDQYLVLSVGWTGGRRVRGTHLYLRLRNGKVWIEEDWTDWNMAGQLLQAGVPREDIVLAFQPPEKRALTEFAVA